MTRFALGRPPRPPSFGRPAPLPFYNVITTYRADRAD